MKTNFDLSKLIEKRQSVKHFAARPVAPKLQEELLNFIYGSPTVFNAMPYRVLAINTARHSELVAALAATAFLPSCALVAEPPLLLCFFSLKSVVAKSEAFIREIATNFVTHVFNQTGPEAAASVEHAVKNYALGVAANEVASDDFAMKDAFVALANALTGAALLDLDASAVTGFKREEMEAVFLKHQLINPDERVAALAAIGYRRDDTAFAHGGSGRRGRPARESRLKII